MFRREVLSYALPFPQELPEQRHDHWVAIVAMALGDVEYVARPLYDYVQHGDAVLGHAQANQGAPSARRTQTDSPGGVLAGWGLVHDQHYPRLLLAATVLELRVGDELAADRAKAIDRVLASDSLRGMAWLEARAIRALLRGDRDHAARPLPRPRDCVAANREAASPQGARPRRTGRGRGGAARPAGRRRRSGRQAAGGAGRRLEQVVPGAAAGEPDADQAGRPPGAAARPPDAARAQGHLIRDRSGRVLRDHRPQRVGQRARSSSCSPASTGPTRAGSTWAARSCRSSSWDSGFIPSSLPATTSWSRA